jgi:hypothetical protein
MRQALEEAGRTSGQSILDFDCGHGRVLRSLAAAERRLRDRQVLLFNLELPRIATILEGYDNLGFGYNDYRKYRGTASH